MTFITCHSAECRYAECRVLVIAMLNVVMLNLVRLSVVMLSVVAPLESLEPHHPLPVLFYLSDSDEVKRFDKIRHLSKTAMPQAIASIHLMRQDELRTEKGRRIAKNLEKRHKFNYRVTNAG